MLVTGRPQSRRGEGFKRSISSWLGRHPGLKGCGDSLRVTLPDSGFGTVGDAIRRGPAEVGSNTRMEGGTKGSLLSSDVEVPANHNRGNPKYGT